MKTFLLSLLIVFSIFEKTNAQCMPSPGNIYSFTFSGLHYEIVKENLNWKAAAACAHARGGKLSEIESRAEQDTLYSYLNKVGIITSNTVAPDGGGASYVWLGGNDLAVEGNWIWDGINKGTGIPFWQGKKPGIVIGARFNNWGNEPDDYNNQDCLGLGLTNWPNGIAGQWNDLNENNLLYYVIEYAAASFLPQQENAAFSFYPNPAHDIISLNIPVWRQGLTYTITDQTGRLIQTGDLTSQQSAINIYGLRPGMYQISTALSNTYKLVIQ